MKKILNELYDIHDQKYDNTTSGFANVFYPIITNGYSDWGYSYFFGEVGSEQIYGQPDPKEILYNSYGNSKEYYYYKLNADNVDWIARNIYNIEPDHSLYITFGSDSYSDQYYYDGNYYIMSGDAGYIGHETDIIDYKIMSDGRYYVTVNYNVGESFEINTNYMIVDLKNINGQRQWTVYKNSKHPFEYEAKNPIKVLLNSKELSFDVEPYIENGTTMVPMRAIFEALGAEVNYDAETKTITAYKDNIVIKLFSGYNNAKINNRDVALPVAVANKNGNTMVPLRFISESLNATVDWNNNSKTITIQS